MPPFTLFPSVDYPRVKVHPHPRNHRSDLGIATLLPAVRQQLLSGNGAADQAGRVVAELTYSSRLGDATARAVRAWAQDT